MLLTIPKILDAKLACDHSDICATQVQGSYMHLHARNAPNKCLGQQNYMRLIVNVRL